MCLGIPMRLLAVEAERGTAELEGARQEVNLSLVEAPEPGDFVIVHAGFAIEKLDVAEAEARLALFREMAEEDARGADGAP